MRGSAGDLQPRTRLTASLMSGSSTGLLASQTFGAARFGSRRSIGRCPYTRPSKALGVDFLDLSLLRLC